MKLKIEITVNDKKQKGIEMDAEAYIVIALDREDGSTDTRAMGRVIQMLGMCEGFKYTILTDDRERGAT